MIEIGEIYKVPLGVGDDITPKGAYDSRNKYCAVIAKPEYGLVVAYVIFDHDINDLELIYTVIKPHSGNIIVGMGVSPC